METTTKQIEDIKEMIGRLSANRLQEVHDFIAFLLEKERVLSKVFKLKALKSLPSNTLL